MGRDCKGICKLDPMFTKKRLPPNEGSYCSKCVKSYKNPIHWLHGAIIELLPNPWDLITRYYDKDGKRKNVRIFRPIKYLVRQEYCKCCGTKFRAGPLSKTDERRKKGKVQVTIKIPRGRKKGVKNRIPKLMEKIDVWLKGENMPSILQQYNEVGFEYSASDGKPLDEILDIFRGSAQGSGDWKEFNEINDNDVSCCKKIVLKKLKAYAKKHKLEITNETETKTNHDN